MDYQTRRAIVCSALDGVRKINQKGYAFYVVANGKIESGWEYAEDAKEHKAENMPEKLRAGAKVMQAKGLKAAGLDPNDNASWMKSGDALDGVPKLENLAFRDQVEQNSKARSGTGKAKIDAAVHAWASKKFAKGNGDTITNVETAVQKQKIEIHTSKLAITITPFGDFYRVHKSDGVLSGGTNKSEFYRA